MNNLPLQPLKWHEQQGWFSTKSPLTEYQIAKQSDKYRVLYIKRSDQFAREATGFATIDEAKTWAWKHYNEKMQPYVKPTPTWIDVSERLPEDDGKYLVATSCGKQWMGNYNLPPKPNKWMLNGWSMNGGWHPFDITHWMPIPEFSTMQIFHKGE